jgi:drug/metabolite transporter (DMT)-like permease
LLLGWLVVDEKHHARIWLAMMITIGGIYIVNRGYQLRNAWRAQVSAGR